MRDAVNSLAPLDLTKIAFHDTAEIGRLVSERHEHLFDTSDDGYFDRYMSAVESLFAGDAPEYQAMDTAYHDISHTLQATLCLAELLQRRHEHRAAPAITAHDFRRAIVAVLFHDVGFLKKAGDYEGSGAKYTHVHERRSCEFARAFLERRDWPDDDIQFVENLISSTGPRVNLIEVEFRSEVESVLGRAVCTADYIGQISDPRYPDRLESLFNEFAESFRYQGIPRDQWMFGSYEALLRGTPGFWDTFVQRKLNEECAGLWRYFEAPVTGDNPYMASVARNLVIIREKIAAID